MSDLISRKETYNELIESIDWLRERDYELYCVIGDSIRVCLDEQPTAYDIDKVVEELSNDVCEYENTNDEYCKWKINSVFPETINNPHAAERENIATTKYCPYCGKKIKAVE
ncbi:MAG: hypothetical protein MSG78_11650 [Clostridiales bacterium]|nr:hypothetical protein [Clostridiales bacterium]